MNYKKVIRNSGTRRKILELLRFIPDKPMIKLQYWIKTGRSLNLINPQRFSEKIQWYKLNYKDPLMIQCVDKYEVRKYVESRGMGHILNECYGVFDQVEDIEWNSLPNSFVVKDTLGGGGNNVIIVKDKKTVNLKDIISKCRKWTETNLMKSGGREWPYYSGKRHRIIIEEYLECQDGDLPDYKFFCFNGEVDYSYIKVDYAKSHQNGRLTFFDSQGKQLNVKIDYCEKISNVIKLPMNFCEMAECARVLSGGFPHVRVDFYNVDGRIVFGELTFYNASGYFSFEPDSFDYELGECFVLNKYVNTKVK